MLYFSAPHFTFDAFLRHSSLTLELLSDINQYLFIIKGIRGGTRNLDRSFRNIYIIPSFPTREQHAHSVQNARSRFTKLNQ